MPIIQKAEDIGVDLAVPGTDRGVLICIAPQEASPLPHIESKRTIRVVAIRCQICFKSVLILILDKRTNKWVCNACCDPLNL